MAPLRCTYRFEDLASRSFTSFLAPGCERSKPFSECGCESISKCLAKSFEALVKHKLEKPHLFKPCMIEIPIVTKLSTLDFLDTVDKKITEEVDETAIIFISDLDDIIISHYMTQPKSRLQRKLLKNFIEEDYGNFDCN